MYPEYADEFIEEIRCQLPENHPLADCDFYPTAKQSKKSVFLIDNETTGKEGVLDFTRTMRRKGKKMIYYKEFKDVGEIQAMIDKDHDEWLSTF